MEVCSMWSFSMDWYLILEKVMLNGIFDIKESKKNLKKNPFSLPWIFHQD